MERHRGASHRVRQLVVGLVLGALPVVAASPAGAALSSVGLRTAHSFAVLAGAGVTNTGPTIVNGDLGTCPTPAITGFPPGVANGTIHAADAVACGAKDDLTIAYNDAAGRAATTTYSGPTDLGGTTLTTGVYKSPTSFAITGTLTLDAQGDPNAVFIFQAGATVITAVNSRVSLVNGAQACNVFWQVGSSATLGVGATFVGTILALTSITANTNATVLGRLLARNGATTLDSNTITTSVCASAASSTVTVNPPVQGLFTLEAGLTETSTGAPIAGRTVVMRTSAGPACQAVTNAAGVATCDGVGAALQIVVDNGYTASFAGDSQFLPSSARATLLAGGRGSSSVSPLPPGTSESGPPTEGSTTGTGRTTGPLPSTGDVAGMREWGLLLLAAGAVLAMGRSALRRRV
jgi:hypothetical protein